MGRKYSKILLSLSLESMDNNDFYRFSFFYDFSEMIDLLHTSVNTLNTPELST